MAYETELQFAIQAVSQAARLAIAVQREIASDDALAKEDRSPVTVADFGVQALISHALQQAYPNDPFMGEENSAALSSPEAEGVAGKIIQRVVKIKSEIERDEVLPLIDRASHDGGSTGRFWTLDPIDGTKGFLRRQQYAIALALIENGEVVAGVLGCPNLSSGGDPENGSHGSIFAACKGQGAQTLTIDGDHPTTICTRDISETDAAIVCESVEAAHSDHSTSAEVARILGITADPVRIDSQCKYAVVARGDADIYLRLPTRPGYQECIWDHAAGAIIIEEAGGKVTDIHGKPLDFSKGSKLTDNQGVIATSGNIHQQVLSAVSQAMA